ncbi:phosphatase PAP2 family protein [Streptomyces sp. LX-29]|uniref:bifunctional phosphatase PAP2/diacylglycerol kinase family protein n=1 Tax=Streptomyces sp. LX-29 TaxID=2900152 RepID=UPI00240D516F|nr:bifunctional phosphatase PAP2/diacylglycerol kinase family protein [Streptomyces sp. LX-29]WFB10693.1 phosphatase PAP2 family protein [Streptomyces sp. LX-29]
MGPLSDLDRHLFARVAAGRFRGAHPLLPRLSRAADHGRLWMGTAAVLAAVGGRTARRAALRGVGSLAAASLASNAIVKWTVERRRPVIDAVPVVRRLARQPWTSSFPSGHSASAAAFATGVALESLRYGALVAPVAAAVAVSRVYVGVHYPSDVLAGVAVGATAAALTCRWWPPRPETPAQARPRVSAPALPGGAGLCVVVNRGAGPGAGFGPVRSYAEQLRDLLPAAEIMECGPDDDFGALLDRAARRAAERGGALGICGGDGSVNAAAALAVERRLPLAVFPGGTLNHFALDVGVPAFDDTAYAVEEGDAVAVDLAYAAPAEGDAANAARGGGAGPDAASVAGASFGPAAGSGTGGGSAVGEGPATTGDGAARTIPFVNTFSVGLYPELVHLRERLQGRLGKWPATAVALARVLRTGSPTEMEINGRPHRVWLLFVGNGHYAPEGFAPAYRERLDDGLLDVRLIDGNPRLARTRVILAAVFGALEHSHIYMKASVRRLRLTGLGDTARLAHDGEVAPAPDALLIAKRPGALTVYRPAVLQSEFLQTARAAAAAARRLGEAGGTALREG